MTPAHHPANVAKPRAILNEMQAIQIFQIKLSANTFMYPYQSSAKIAELFGISKYAVLEIWKGHTWGNETCHMDPSLPAPVKKHAGRPKGFSKDSKPRATLRQRNAVVVLGVEKQN